MKWLFPIFFLFLLPTLAKPPVLPIKIAVVDTGLNLNDLRFKDHLCSSGHQDFTGTGMQDTIGHGTFVAGLIVKYAEDANYCIIVYKYYTESGDIFQSEMNSFQDAIKNGAKIINFSAGGKTYEKREFDLINNHPEVTFVFAVGNKSSDIDTDSGNFFPASYHTANSILVGNINTDGTHEVYSNWTSQQMYWEVGNVYSTLPDDKTGHWNGSSFSAAIKTGKLIREMSNAK